MNRKEVLVPLVLLLLITVACKPDLVVKDVTVTWDAANKKVKAEIANIGDADAGEFLVYFDGDEQPVSQNHRPQVRTSVPGLARGQSMVLDADFAPLAHPDNNNLGNIFQITVRADPKSNVSESNENNNVKSCAVSSAPSVLKCVTFGPPPPAGTEYGQPAGNTPGQVVLVTADGIKMAVYDFVYTSGGGTFRTAKIESPTPMFGDGQTIRTSNINLEFDFSGLGAPVSEVTLEFRDAGGNENLAVNGQPSPIYAGELVSAPSVIAGVTVTVTSTSMPGGKKGKVVFRGPIQTIRIGGQEFWLDNVCVTR